MADEQGGADRPLVDAETGFEVAVGILDDLVGYAARRIRSERSSANPNADTIAEWERRQDDWISRRRGLHPRDGLRVRTILEEDGAFLRSLPAE
jgi:hypothetical protein